MVYRVYTVKDGGYVVYGTEDEQFKRDMPNTAWNSRGALALEDDAEVRMLIKQLEGALLVRQKNNEAL